MHTHMVVWRPESFSAVIIAGVGKLDVTTPLQGNRYMQLWLSDFMDGKLNLK